MRLFLRLANNNPGGRRTRALGGRVLLSVGRAIGKLEAAGGVYPDVVPEIVFVEIGEVDGGDICNGMIAQRSFAGKRGDAMCGQSVIFDVGSGLSVGQLEHKGCAAYPEVQGKIADHPGQTRRIKSRDGKVDAGGGILAMNACKNQWSSVDTIDPGFKRFNARAPGYP